MDSMGQKDVFGDKTPGNENIEPTQDEKGSSTLPSKRGAKPKCQVTSSWALRPKSREKSKASEPSESVKEGSTVVEKKRRRKKKEKKKTKNSTCNEFSRTKKHLRYLLHRIRYEQNLIDAYTADGWKGQSLEKLKPEKELIRAKSHILRYKLKIRALFQQLDQSLSVGKIPEVLFDAKGEIDSEDIFCAKCGSKDLTLDNDIILCDGSCERGFHQYCLEPPLLKEQIPLGDEGWLCPGCDCKVDCIDLLSDFQGTKLSVLDSWEKIFPEAASGQKPDDGLGYSSDDSEDGDYDPEKPDTEEVEGDASSSDDANYFSASDDLCAPATDEKNLGLPSDDSEDDDFDPSGPDPDERRKADSSNSDFSSDSEDVGALIDDAAVPGEENPGIISQPSDEQSLKACKVGKKVKEQSLKDEISYLLETSGEPVTAKRHVERLDYKKLNDETFGDISSDTSDEDFQDDTSPKRKRTKRDKKETVKKPLRQSKHSSTNTKENAVDLDSASTSTKASQTRFKEAVKKRLYEVFTENQYPEKSVRENLAKELGMTVEQVRKWFENARFSLNHRTKMESHITTKPHKHPPSITAITSTDDTICEENAKSETLITIPAQKSDLGLDTNTRTESSPTKKSKMRKG